MDHDYGLQWSTERIEEIQWALKGQVCQSLYKNIQGIAMFLVYNVHIHEHRNVQYTIEQYGENNKQRAGMYMQWHWASTMMQTTKYWRD